VPNIAGSKMNGTFLWKYCIENRAAWQRCAVLAGD
jgi:hypothetical protein